MRTDDVALQLAELGVRPGQVLVVHTAFSNVRPIEGGPAGLIAALRAALGPEGTLVMPSMADDDQIPFDVGAAPCLDMGVVADLFWRMPGVLRSDSFHAFAALGPRAPEITRPHPIEVPHGLDSPVGRVYELDGHVLLLGVGHHANTTAHLAENLAGVRYRTECSSAVQRDGRVELVRYAEPDHCCQGFELLDGWLGEACRHGAVGSGEGRLARSRAIVEVAVAHLHQDETAFLHPSGQCEECDAARASLPISPPS